MIKMVNSNHILYIKSDYNKILVILKIGVKNLFIRNSQGNIFEISPLCVLDFYVHESIQRMGIGKVNFNRKDVI